MQWMVSEIVAPFARRVGGQSAAALVALGMAGQHEAAVAAAIAWAVVSVAELAVSSRGRSTLKAKAREAWGRN